MKLKHKLMSEKLLNENVKLMKENREYKETIEDLTHILNDYKRSEKEEHTINDMLLNELKNKFKEYKISYNLYLVPCLEFVDGDCLDDVYLTFCEDKYIISGKYISGYGFINRIKL